MFILLLALRPEKIEISREQPGGEADNRVAGTVAEIAYLGEQSVYLVRLATGRQVRVTRPNRVRQAGVGRITWDEQVWLSWDPSSPVVVTQ